MSTFQAAGYPSGGSRKPKRVLEPGEIDSDEEDDREEDELEDEEDEGYGGPEPGEIVDGDDGLEPGELPPTSSSGGAMGSGSSSAKQSAPKKVPSAGGAPKKSNPPNPNRTVANVNIPSNWAQKWTEEEDGRLLAAIEQFGENSWKQVAQMVGTRDAGKSIIL